MAGHSNWATIQHRRSLRRARAHGGQRDAGQCVGERAMPVRLEGYGPGDAALLVDCLTADRDRTVAEVRHALQRHGGELGASGAVGYLFNEVGLLVFAPGADSVRLAAAAIQAGAEDVVANPDASVEVLTDPGEIASVQRSLAAAGFVAAEGEITFRAYESVDLAADAAQEMVHLIDDLECLDDVEHVYSNAAIPSEILARV